MSALFVTRLQPGPAEIDALGHVNNLVYVGWMQAVAIEHSAHQGWPLQRYIDSGGGWVVRSHTIRYKRSAFAGDEIELLTWVASFAPRSSVRRYLFRRAVDQAVLAEAETDWAYVDFASGRPRAIPADLRAAFTMASPEEEAAAGWR